MANLSPSTPLSCTGAYVMLGACLPVWGINRPAMKIAVVSIPPVWLACVRMATTCVCQFAALTLVRKPRVPNRQDLPAVISVGVIMMGIYPALTMTGLAHASAGRALPLSFITPLWVTPAGIFLFGERLGALKAAGLVVGLAGLLFFAGPVATSLTVIGAITIVRSLPAITASLLFLATPVAGMLCSAAVLGEPFTWTNIVGLLLIITGLAFVSLGEIAQGKSR